MCSQCGFWLLWSLFYKEHTTAIIGMWWRSSTKPGLQTSNNLCKSPGHLMLFNMNLSTAQVESKYLGLHISQHQLPLLYYFLLLPLTDIRRHIPTQDMFLTFKTVSHFSAKVSVNLVLLLTSVTILWCNNIYIPLNSSQTVTVQMIANIMVAAKFIGETLV